MKYATSTIRIISFLLMLNAGNFHVLGQSTATLTPEGVFDNIYDQFGNVERLEDLRVGGLRQLGNSSSVTAVYGSCVAGYFTLYFQVGSLFSNNPGTQSVICQAFTDISNYIISPASPGQVKIFVGVPGNGSAGLAYSYFLSPSLSNALNLGIEDNLVYKVLTSGVDPFSTIPFSVITSPTNPPPGYFYHGRIDIDPVANWNFDLSTTNIASNEIDLYSICLHEATHLLGVYSLINYNGQSNSLNYSSNIWYNRYDQFLTDNSGSPLIAPVTASCPCSANGFSNIATSIALGGNCTNTVLNVSTCSLTAQYVGNYSTMAVFTPTCYQPGSSLSHFEDMCSTFGFSTSCTRHYHRGSMTCSL